MQLLMEEINVPTESQILQLIGAESLLSSIYINNGPFWKGNIFQPNKTEQKVIPSSEKGLLVKCDHFCSLFLTIIGSG